MDYMRKIKILLIICFVVILIIAVVMEIVEYIYKLGYYEKLLDFNCKDSDSVDTSVNNILELMEVYKFNVIWRKVFLIAFVITGLYFCMSKDDVNFKNYSILLIITFALTYQLTSYLMFHSFLPICKVMKNNLDYINKKK
jgi:magnesium-transporting ATPase (P-type)